MQNRKQKKGSLQLPLIKKSHKYNQQNAKEGQKQFPLLSINKQIASTYQQYVPKYNSYQIRVKTINHNNSSNYVSNKSNSYSTMRKVQKQVQSPNVLKPQINLSINLNLHLQPIKIASSNINQHKRVQNKQVILSNKKINTKQKPPHRYKTTMLMFKHCMLLYGGLGCQKNLTWAKLNFENMNWQIGKQISGIKPINMYFPCSPIYGHTMVKYKDMAVVYGGSCIDQVNQTTIIHTKTMNITQGAKCQFRRKQHAAVVINNLMVVHGGIQAKQVKSQLFVYNISSDRWIVMPNTGLPALSSHKICKGKSSKQLYIFGGINSKGKSTNKLYRIKQLSIQTNQLKWQLIQCQNSPKPRHSFCFQQLTNNLLLLYGGHQDNQTCNQIEGIQNGVFNDVHTYNIDKRIWQRVLIHAGFQYCFGMASTSMNGTVFIYGGSNHSLYADASINMIWNSIDRNDPWQSVQGSQAQIYSSKKISTKFIVA